MAGNHPEKEGISTATFKGLSSVLEETSLRDSTVLNDQR